MAKDLVSVAIQEIGYKEQNHNGGIYTKYGAYTGHPSEAWCMSFVAWCCKNAKLKSYPKTASTDAAYNWFYAMDWYKGVSHSGSKMKHGDKTLYDNSYCVFTPQRNDILFIKNNYSHVAIVEKIEHPAYLQGYTLIHTIDGNSDGQVKRNSYFLEDSRVSGIGRLYDDLKVSNDVSKPSNVKAVCSADNTISITWSAPQGNGYSYNIYYDGVKQNDSASSYLKYVINYASKGSHTIGVQTVKGTKVSNIVTLQVLVTGKTYESSNAKKTAQNTGTTPTTTKNSSSSKSGKEELKYLQQFLKTINNTSSKKQQNVNLEITKINYHHDVKVVIIIQNGKKLFSPPVIEGLKVVWERKNTAGKMTFQTIYSGKYKIREGNPVLMSLNGQKFFYGFVFTVKKTKDEKIDVTVYDQLRYLKNKDTYIYKKKTTDSLIRMIAKDMGLNVGTLSKTKHLITRAEDNLTLFDIISNSLNETLMATGNIYTLYDDCGKLMLKKPTNMKVLDSLIDADTAEDYTYSRSIDQDVYNQIKLEYQNDKGKVQFYYTRSKKNISKWGTLQYFEKIDSPKIAKLKGQVLLKLYNKVSNALQINGAFGNPKVRAGSLIPVLLDLGDIKVSSFLLVDKVTHTFNNGIHKMDLNLSGGDFDSSE